MSAHPSHPPRGPWPVPLGTGVASPANHAGALRQGVRWLRQAVVQSPSRAVLVLSLVTGGVCFSTALNPASPAAAIEPLACLGFALGCVALALIAAGPP